MDAEKYINTDDAAKFLSHSVLTIRTWAASGFIPSYKIGGRRLYKTSELDAWVKTLCSGRKRLKSFMDQDTNGQVKE